MSFDTLTIIRDGKKGTTNKNKHDKKTYTSKFGAYTYTDADREYVQRWYPSVESKSSSNPMEEDHTVADKESSDTYWSKWDDYQESYHKKYHEPYIPGIGIYTIADMEYDKKWHPNGKSNFLSPDALEEVANGLCESDW